MAFLQEDGTGLAASNSYGSVAGFRTYHQDRGATGVDESTPTDEVVEQMLIKASQYIDRRFGASFKGILGSSTQAMAWPRSYAYDERGVAYTLVPTVLEEATYEYALRANSAALWPDEVAQTQGKVVKEKVGPIEVTYAKGGSLQSYPLADSMLRLITRGRGVIRV